MNFAVLQFPASNCDQDAIHAVRRLGHSARFVWHKDNSLGGADAVLVPGGFSYGDYLRCGAIARFSPVMQAVKQFADNGGLVLGICNGFQVLTEAQLLPGALVRNRDLQFHCEHIYLKTVTPDSPFSSQIPPEKILRVPIAHGEGCYFADDETLGEAKGEQPDSLAVLRREREHHRRVEPERFAAKHRRHLQRAPERGRPHAASRTRLRAVAGERRRQFDFRKYDRRPAKQAREGGVTAESNQRKHD